MSLDLTQVCLSDKLTLFPIPSMLQVRDVPYEFEGCSASSMLVELQQHFPIDHS